MTEDSEESALWPVATAFEILNSAHVLNGASLKVIKLLECSLFQMDPQASADDSATLPRGPSH
jgi:hypothetical protein